MSLASIKASAYRLKRKFVAKLMKLIIRITPVRKKLVFFECFLGQSYGDNPKYIHQEMVRRGMDKKYILIWALKKERMDVDIIGKHRKVKYLGVLYFWYLLRSKYIINNSRFPFFVTTNAKSIFLQTWHGTPLKRLGLDQGEVYLPNTNTQRYKRNMIRSSLEWDYMITQNSFSSERFCSAFGVDRKNIIEIGYPRDDLLSLKGEEKDIKTNEIKEKLGIPFDKKVLLYAPTFRDDDHNGSKYGHTFAFDLKDFAEKIGDEYVVLLRLHYLVSQSLGEGKPHERVINASDYPDITELYLIADLMVTDYSSVMFDYSITRRPMIFYMYDIEKYRDQLRGFYFDIKELPGPVVSNYKDFVNEVVKHQENADKYAKKYDKYINKFTYLDDGNASKRAVDILFFNK